MGPPTCIRSGPGRKEYGESPVLPNDAVAVTPTIRTLASSGTAVRFAHLLDEPIQFSFPIGSAAPKIASCCRLVETVGRTASIGPLTHAIAPRNGTAGTASTWDRRQDEVLVRASADRGTDRVHGGQSHRRPGIAAESHDASTPEQRTTKES